MTDYEGFDLLLDVNGHEQECATTLCTYTAIEQTDYDSPLCPMHYKDELLWDEADNGVKARREEYGQFETDGSVG